MRISDLNLITFPEEAKADGFYASHKRKYRSTDTHWHDFYEIHVITQGNLTEYINGHKIDMGPGWIYFLRPYDLHEYHGSDLVSLYKIQFMIDILDPEIQKILIANEYRLAMKLSEKEQESLEPFLNKIVDEYNSNKHNRLTMISYLMNCLTTEIIRLGQKHTPRNASSDSIVMALEYIHRNYSNNISMQDVADLVGLTPNYFCSKFHKEVGQSFKQYLRGLQLNHAATLLRISDQSISSICENCGINSLAIFFKDFREVYGVTPSQYRNQCLQDK